jgi:hypothetical protein
LHRQAVHSGQTVFTGSQRCGVRVCSLFVPPLAAVWRVPVAHAGSRRTPGRQPRPEQAPGQKAPGTGSTQKTHPSGLSSAHTPETESAVVATSIVATLLRMNHLLFENGRKTALGPIFRLGSRSVRKHGLAYRPKVLADRGPDSVRGVPPSRRSRTKANIQGGARHPRAPCSGPHRLGNGAGGDRPRRRCSGFIF